MLNHSPIRTEIVTLPNGKSLSTIYYSIDFTIGGDDDKKQSIGDMKKQLQAALEKLTKDMAALPTTPQEPIADASLNTDDLEKVEPPKLDPQPIKVEGPKVEPQPIEPKIEPAKAMEQQKVEPPKVIEKAEPQPLQVGEIFYLQETLNRLEQAQHLWDKNEKEKAIEIYKEKDHHPVAQFHLGKYCKEKENKEQAFAYFLKAAKQRHLDAQYTAALCLLWGIGTLKDETSARNWLQHAALNGHSMAQYCLAHFFCAQKENEKFVYVEWMLKSAQGGHAEAQFDIARIYGNGLRGVEKDLKQAFEWYERASAQNHAEAQYQVGVCYRYGYGVEKNVDVVLVYYEKAAKQGLKKAYCQTGYLYDEDAREGPRDRLDNKKANKWYQKCVEEGDACRSCLCNWSFSFRANNPAKAIELITRAAAKGNVNAQFELAGWYDKGNPAMNIPRKLLLAVEYYKQAAANGHKEAQEILGAPGFISV